MPETKEAPERVWRTTNAYIYNGPTPEPCVEYIRLDLHDAAVEQARREVWERAIYIAKQVAAWPNAGVVGRQIIVMLEAAAGKEVVCVNCGCPPPQGGEIGEWCSACGAGVEYESAKEFERRHGSTSK